MSPIVDDLVALGHERKCCVGAVLAAPGRVSRKQAICDGPLTTFLLLRGIEERFPVGGYFDGDCWQPASLPEWHSDPRWRFLPDLLADKRAWGIACERHRGMVGGEECDYCDGAGFRSIGGGEGAGPSAQCSKCNGTGHTEPSLVLPREALPDEAKKYAEELGL